MTNDALKSFDKRARYIDFLRILAIAFVILLHSITGYITNVSFFGTKTWWFCLLANGIARTGVPLFFMISGYLLLDDARTLHIFKFYRKRFARILIPFIIWDVIYFTVKAFTGNDIAIAAFFKELLVTGSMYHLWFVYEISGLYLTMPFIKRIVDNCSTKELLLLLMIITSTCTIFPLINTVTPVYISLFMSQISGYIGYALLGYILGKKTISRPVAIIIYIGGLAGFLFGVIGNHMYSSAEKIDLRLNGGFRICYFLSAAAIFVFAKHFMFRKSLGNHSVVTKISSTTYGVYLMHVLVLERLQSVVATKTPILNIAVCAGATFVISAVVMFAISKIKYANKLLM